MTHPTENRLLRAVAEAALRYASSPDIRHRFEASEDFIAAANPQTILSLLNQSEADRKRIEELEGEVQIWKTGAQKWRAASETARKWADDMQLRLRVSERERDEARAEVERLKRINGEEYLYDPELAAMAGKRITVLEASARALSGSSPTQDEEKV